MFRKKQVPSSLPEGERGEIFVPATRQTSFAELQLAEQHITELRRRASELKIQLIMQIDRVQGGFSLSWRPVPTVCDISVSSNNWGDVTLRCESHNWNVNLDEDHAALTKINELSAAHMKEAYAG